MIYLIDNLLKLKTKKSNDCKIRSLSFVIDYITFSKFQNLSKKNIKQVINQINQNKFSALHQIS